MKKLFSIFALFSLAAGFVACEQTEPQQETTKPGLTADKTEILADGVDKVTFTATVNGEANEGIQIILLNDNSIIEGNTFTTTTAGEYQFKAIYGNESSETIKVTATKVQKTVKLEADKSEIQADNADTVTFTVKVDGEVINSGYVIINRTFNIKLEGNTFTSDVYGDFNFIAEYDDFKSNDVTVVVTPVEVPAQKTLKIKSDVNRIKADGEDKATLTVMYGEEDVTAKSEIYVEQTKEVLTDATFSTTAAATYTIRAKYEGMTSTFVTIDAYDPNLAGKYELGTIIEVNGVKGMIFAIKGFPVYNDEYTEVIRTDQYCYIVSLDEEDLQWSTKYEWCNCMSQRGDYNSSDPFKYWGMNIDDYPAFKWCKEHGEGWFLPSSTEMHWMWDMLTNGERDFDAPSVAEYNEFIMENGGEPFCEDYYWSSNETSEDLVEVIAFMDDSVVCLDPKKDNTYTARAAYRFKVE